MATEDISSQQQGDDNWYSKHEDWIKANIKQRDCYIFQRDCYGGDCVCGKPEDNHTKSPEKGRWKKEVNTQTSATTAFGTTEIEDGEEIQFVRIDEDTPFKHIKHLLFEVWDINEPKWILPLIGSQTDDHKLEIQLKEEISHVFQKLSTVSDLWILSDGLDNGISEYILGAKSGEWIDYRITSIGCASWTEGLMQEGEESGSFEYKTDREIFSIRNAMSNLMLVDNGTVDTYLCTLSISSFLTKMIAGLSVPEDASRAFPAVAILFCGELYTLETIRNYLRENIPVVIVKDSGCVADAFCYAMEKSKGVSHKMKDDKNERFGTVISQLEKKQLRTMLSEMEYGVEVDEYEQVILQCLQRRDLLSVVDLSTEGALFQGIISAIIRTKTSTDLISMVDEYLPTPVYNRKTKEKAEKHIENKRDDNYKDLEDAENIVKMVFKEAILQEKSECVEFLLDCGVSAVEDLDMLELYQNTEKGLQKTVSEIYHKSKEEHNTSAYSEQQQTRDYMKEFDSQMELVQKEVDLSEIHRNLYKKYAEFRDNTDQGSRGSMSDDAEKIAASETNDRNAAIRSFTDGILVQFVPRVFTSTEQNTDSSQKEDPIMGGEIFTQLFLWAVLTNRNLVARQFWTRGQDLVVSALIAGTIMESIADKTYNSRKKAVRKANASFYRSLTVGTMDACYWDHKKTTVKLIDKRIKDNVWDIDFLALAFESKNSSVFNSEGIVFYTLSKWYGDIPKSTSLWKLLLCTLCPAFIWVFLKEKSGSVRKPDSHTGPHAAQEKNNCTTKTCGCFSRLGTYYSTPVIKYTSYLLVYCTFLGLYSHFMLIVLTLDFKWNWEIPLLVWMVAFLVEEAIQIAQFTKEQKNKSRNNKKRNPRGRRFHNLKVYIQDEWNVLDICCILGFILGYTLRWIPATYDYGRLFLSINCMCFIWRFLQAFTLSKTIGPMLYMMFKMVKDILPFLVILCVPLFSYAVSTEAILYPNSVWSVDFVLQIPVTAFWLIFGELDFLGDLETCSGPTCPSNIGRRYVPYFTAIYMIMTNVLLLNLLIARFNHIFDEVRGKSDEVWARQRCSLMLEYESGKKKQLPGDDKKDVAETISLDDYNCDYGTQRTDLNSPSNDEVVSLRYSEVQGENEPPETILPGQCNLSEEASDKDGSFHDGMEAGDDDDEETQHKEEGDNGQQSDFQVTETGGTSQDGENQLDDEDDPDQQTAEFQQHVDSDNGVQLAEQADTEDDREAEPEIEDHDVYKHTAEVETGEDFDDNAENYDEEYYGYYGTESEVCSDDDMEYYASEEDTKTQTDEDRRKGEINLDEFEKANAQLYLHERVN